MSSPLSPPAAAPFLLSPPDPFAIAADIFDPPRDEDYELAIACRDSLATLVRQAWPILNPATPYVHGWHVETVCYHLEAVTAGELPRLVINQPPRTSKSTITNVCWPAWEWLDAPGIRYLCASYAAELAIRDSVATRQIIQTPGGRAEGTLLQRRGYYGLLQLLGHDWRLTGDQNAKLKFENTERGYRLATSVDGRATGEGGDRIVIDDPIDARRARSDRVRGETNRWWSETMSTRFNSDRSTGVLVMQRLHENDLSGHLIERGWHHLCLPAEYEPSHPFVYPDRVVLPERQLTVQGDDGGVETVTIPGGRELPGDPRTEPGELLEPVRLGPRRLAELRRELGSYGYAGQLQQRPTPAEGGMFDRSWWQRWTPATLPPRWQRLICSWDMRFGDSEKAASSYVVGQVWGQDGADRYLLGQIRARLSFVESVAAVKALAAWRTEAHLRTAPSAKLVEDKANGPAVISTLRRRITGLIAITPDGGKDVRAAAAQPIVEAGNVYLPSSDTIPCPAGYEPTTVQDFIEECAGFPLGTHDDQVDGMTQALNWLEGHDDAQVETVAYRDAPAADVVVHTGDLVLVGEQFIDKP